MTSILRSTLAASLLALIAGAGSSLAADADVVAKVGAVEITERDLTLATADLGQEFGQLPPEQRRLAVLSALIDIKALSQQAEKAGLAEDPEVKERIALLRDRALHNAFFQKQGVDALTDEELKARYEAEIAKLPPVPEIHARHILVKTKEEAEAAIEELDAGADFMTLASTKSSGPSGPQGGDLGFFGPGQMVPAFEAAASQLEPGQYSKEPVETQFGWHVIKVEEKRNRQPPAFEEVKDQVRQLVMREKYVELVQEARETLTVEYVDPAIKAQAEALEKAAASPAPAPDAAPAPAEAAPAAAAPAEAAPAAPAAETPAAAGAN